MEPVVGVEPTTYGLQNRCSTTELNWRGVSGKVRTCDHPLRRRMLYPTELQAHNDDINIKRYFADLKTMFCNIILNGRSSRIRTYDPLVPNQVHYQAVLCSDFSQLLLYRTSCGTVCILGATP